MYSKKVGLTTLVTRKTWLKLKEKKAISKTQVIWRKMLGVGKEIKGKRANTD